MKKSIQTRLTSHMNLGDIMRWHEHQALLKETIAYIDKLEATVAKAAKEKLK